MRGILAKRPSGAMVVATVALVMAMGGGAYAAAGSDTKTDKKIANTAATNYFSNHIGTATVAQANNALHANAASTASNALALGGNAPSAFTVRDCNAQTGALKGWAAVNASAGFSSSFVAIPGYNCSGGAVQAKRDGVGIYEVQFVGSPVTVMVGTVNGGATPSGFIDSHFNGSGDFIIGTRNPAGALADGIGFAIITP
jgi:hypothetical protein